MVGHFWPLAVTAALLGVTNADSDQFPHRYQNLEARLRPRGAAGTPEASSPPFYPSPWMNPSADGWETAYAQAKEFVSQMTLMEKVNLTTGVG